jgi:carbon-monoxide dehydrogenase small subunit
VRALQLQILHLQAAGAAYQIAKGGELHPMQAAFHQHHALQCGFCTPGMIMAAVDLLRRIPHPDEATIRANLDGNLCRCTGYHNIVKAIGAVADSRAGA